MAKTGAVGALIQSTPFTVSVSDLGETLSQSSLPYPPIFEVPRSVPVLVGRTPQEAVFSELRQAAEKVSK